MAETLAKRERCSVWEGMLPHKLLHLTLQLHALCQVPSVRDWNLSCACGRVQGRPVPSAGCVGQSEHYLVHAQGLVGMRGPQKFCIHRAYGPDRLPSVLGLDYVAAVHYDLHRSSGESSRCSGPYVLQSARGLDEPDSVLLLKCRLKANLNTALKP